MTPVGLNSLSFLQPTRALHSAQDLIATSMERLATGKRINCAADDPAGVIAAEGLRTDAKVLEKRIEALELEVVRASAHDGAMSVLTDLAIELQGLVVTAANRDGMSAEERQALQIEADSIVKTIDFLANTSTFQGQQILSGYHSSSLGNVTLDPAEPGGEARKFSLADLMGGGALNLVTGDLKTAQAAVDSAVEGLTSTRAAWGARAIAAERGIATLQEELIAVTGALSGIEDADFAKETANLVRGQILQQASIATTMIARQNAQSVLTLLSNTVRPAA